MREMLIEEYSFDVLHNAPWWVERLLPNVRRLGCCYSDGPSERESEGHIYLYSGREVNSY